jgi:hypothetical protein
MSDESESRHRDELLVELSANRAAKIVSEELRKREEQKSKRITLVLSIVTLIGLSGLYGAVSLQIKSAVVNSIQTEISKLTPIIEEKSNYFVQQQIGEVQKCLFENELADDFVELTRKLAEAEDSFSNDLRDTIIDKIIQISKVKRLTKQQRVIDGIGIVVDRFARASLHSQIDKIDEVIGEMLVLDSKPARDLADHYGERIIGSPYPVERLETETGKIQKYLEASSGHGYPEKRVMWKIFIEFKRNKLQKSDTLTKLVESVSDLDAGDKRVFFRYLTLYSNSKNWQKIETQEGRELERLVTALYSIYPELIPIQ